jgi:hypothetical protein
MTVTMLAATPPAIAFVAVMIVSFRPRSIGAPPGYDRFKGINV